MGRTLTNTFGLAYANESSFGVQPTAGWKTLEPNAISAFGAEVTTVARAPISNRRQRRKGTVTDLDSSVEFEADLTHDAFEDFMEAFTFATAGNADLRFRGAVATSSGYTVPALSAAQGSKIQFDAGGPLTLLFAQGYQIAANNGLKPLTADAAAAAVLLTVAGNSAETPPSNAVVEVCGIRCSTGDLSIVVTAGVATLTSGNNGVAGADIVNFTTLGLERGQYVHVGGMAGGQRFSAGFGYGRIRTIAAASLVLDKLVGTLATDTGAGETLDLLFGQFYGNVAVGGTRYVERSIAFEGAFPGLQTPGPGDMYQYALGNYADSFALALPGQDKATVTFGFIGTDTPNPTNTRATGGSTARAPIKTAAFNTSADFLRLRVALIDETGLTTDFKDVTITLKNGVSPEKVLGTLGAKFMNFGNFEVSVEGQIVFTNAAVIDAIRANTTVGMDMILKNGDGAIAFDIPSMTLSGGDREFPVNESVLANLTGEAFEDATLGTSLGWSTFPMVP